MWYTCEIRHHCSKDQVAFTGIRLNSTLREEGGTPYRVSSGRDMLEAFNVVSLVQARFRTIDAKESVISERNYAIIDGG